MKVILLEKVGRKGKLGDQVIVKKGFARNFLFPQGKAVPANADNLLKFEERRAELEAKAAATLAAAQKRADSISAVSLTIACKAGDEGKLFGSVGAQDIVTAMADAGVEIQRSEVRLPHGPIRNLGEYEVVVHVHEDIDANVKVFVVSDSGADA